MCVCSRQRKDELEQRMSSLQESRRELMVQLEGLMKLLKVTHTHTDLNLQQFVFSHTRGQSLPCSSHPPLSVLAVTSLIFPSDVSSSMTFLALIVSDLLFSILLFRPLCFPAAHVVVPVGWGTATGSKSIPFCWKHWRNCGIQSLLVTWNITCNEKVAKTGLYMI